MPRLSVSGLSSSRAVMVVVFSLFLMTVLMVPPGSTTSQVVNAATTTPMTAFHVGSNHQNRRHSHHHGGAIVFLQRRTAFAQPNEAVRSSVISGHKQQMPNSISSSIPFFATRITSLLLSSSTSSSSFTLDIDRIKKMGGGIATIPSGNRQLFDPNQEGKLSGTNNCIDRIQRGATYQYVASSSSSTTTAAVVSPPPSSDMVLQSTEHWLEDIGIPMNYAKAQQPVMATVLGRMKLIDETAPGDIQHVLLQLPNGMHYIEGQSISIIPPGKDPKTGKSYAPRLYSIASTRYGDLLNGQTVSLCVRRAEYVDPTTGQVDPTKAGICSNYLCNLQVGEQVAVAGPSGKTMLLPNPLLPNQDFIFIATGTGIAPFRGYLHRLFMENTVDRHLFNGKVWFILGVPTTSGLLYPDEIDIMKHNVFQQQHGSLEVSYAISREMTNNQGKKLYVQDILIARSNELWERINSGAILYFCGLKGMMPGILEALERVAISHGVDWNTKLKELQANGQWHVEVY